ncbi:reverse transcriptase domain-containing protein [Tanacetum coccineum]|uniref:Reverse transcriptase domain-containing protein n=1 Tax=Tanacetum coccineum TaxID=301880 RepID=A0ABQ5A957_9ASTR
MAYPPLRLEGLPFELEWDPLSNYTIRSSDNFEWRKIIFGMITSMGICHAKAYTLRGRSSTKLGQRDTPFALLNVVFPFVLTQIRNEDLRNELEYFSEDYDEEREMEPRPEPNREATPTLRLRGGRNVEGIRPLEIEAKEDENRGVNLPLLLAAHLGRNESGKPLRSSLTSVHGGHQPSTNIGGNLPHNVTPLSNYPFYTQPMYAPPNMPVYPNPTGSFANSTGSVTPFVRWIDDYPFPNGLKMPSHISSYDGKGDPDNFLHLFEGAIRMQKWLMPGACHMFIYTLKDSARIWWNSQKTCSILNYEDLKAKFRSHFSQQKKFTKTHLAVHNIKKREGASTRAFITRYIDDTLQILGLHEEQRISGFVHGLRTRSLVEHLFADLPSIYKGMMENTYTWIEAREVATNGAPNDRNKSFGRSKKSFWKNNQGHKIRDSPMDPEEERRATSEEHQEELKDILSCVDAKERIVVNDQYQEQTIAIGRKLLTKIKIRKIEVNADDIVIKSNVEEEMLADIKETLNGLQAINLKLNPKKCSFGVEEGIFSRQLITEQGIKANPSKVKAISDLQPPKLVNEIQNLNRNLATLNQADEAFRRMKELLEALPTGVELEYPELEKLILALVYAARKLRRYFQAYLIQVLSDKLIKQILVRPEKSGRIVKWAIELGEHEIEFKGRNSVKEHILADFLAETPLKEEEGAKDEEAKRKETEPKKAWKLFTDGASSSDGSGAGLILVSPEGKEYTYALMFKFKTTNNEAE